jgi:hypothetical protein
MSDTRATDTTTLGLLDALPSPAAIQDRLGQLVREERLLNAMMRLALRAEDEREHRAGRARVK